VARARELLTALDSASALPESLLPATWPGEALRSRYEDFDKTFQSVLRTHLGVD
jgi:DNA-binding transcriptional regulator PaaX